MKSKLKMTLICLHISAALYVLVGIFLIMLPFLVPELDESVSLIVMGVLSFILAIGIEIVIAGLKKNKFWAWVTAIIICGLYIPSAFIVLGALGLWGLLDNDTRSKFLNKRVLGDSSRIG